MIVCVEDELALASLDDDRRDLLGEAALSHRGGAELVASQRVLVLRLARDLARLGDLLSCLRHVEPSHRVHERREERVLELRRGAEGDPVPTAVEGVGSLAHALHAPGEHRLGLTELDHLRAVHERLDAGAAEAVHGQRRAGLSGAGLEADVTRAVDRIDGSLQGVAHHDVIDALSINAGALDGCLRGVGAEVDGGELGELAVTGGADVLAHGGAGCADEDDVLSHVLGSLDFGLLAALEVGLALLEEGAHAFEHVGCFGGDTEHVGLHLLAVALVHVEALADRLEGEAQGDGSAREDRVRHLVCALLELVSWEHSVHDASSMGLGGGEHITGQDPLARDAGACDS